MSEERMILKAYVCGQNCVKWREFEGSSVFDEIYVRRPDDCRYAVVEIDEQIYVIDLFDTRAEHRGGRRLLTRGKTTPYGSLDAAVMATTLGYDNG